MDPDKGTYLHWLRLGLYGGDSRRYPVWYSEALTEVAFHNRKTHKAQ